MLSGAIVYVVTVASPGPSSACTLLTQADLGPARTAQAQPAERVIGCCSSITQSLWSSPSART